MRFKIYECSTCGQMVIMLKDTGMPLVCCGEQMKEVFPNTSDGAREKHLPVWEIKEGKCIVHVGEISHPMDENHFIEWIVVETDKGRHMAFLNPGNKSCFEYCINADEKVKCIYAYCNIHGLYRTCDE